jgi:hypothetical protein
MEGLYEEITEELWACEEDCYITIDFGAENTERLWRNKRKKEKIVVERNI